MSAVTDVIRVTVPTSSNSWIQAVEGYTTRGSSVNGRFGSPRNARSICSPLGRPARTRPPETRWRSRHVLDIMTTSLTPLSGFQGVPYTTLYKSLGNRSKNPVKLRSVLVRIQPRPIFLNPS